jgi:hypothetical protein
MTMQYYDPNRPYFDMESMDEFIAINKEVAVRYGEKMKAMRLSNREYTHRFKRLANENNMKRPPSSHIHIMLGWLVVRKLGQSGQYETWMPEHVFDELYKPLS